MNLRKACETDIDQIEKIYDLILSEEESGNATIGWIRGCYPVRSTAEKALEENSLRWCLDVVFEEDKCPVLDRNTAENLAIIRRIIYNRIKMWLAPKQQLQFGKRSCMYDDDYRLKILFSHA